VDLNVGDPAPDFSLPASSGGKVSLKRFKRKTVVLFFYPDDDTPTCTAEACSIRDRHADIQAAGAVVLGVSRDDIPSHERFIAKYGLPFTLLSDKDAKVATAYGAWGEKVLYGRHYVGMKRQTFIIQDGKIAKIWRRVLTPKHGAEILAAVKALKPARTRRASADAAVV
jgi:peroxiredoxin Q/BCP